MSYVSNPCTRCGKERVLLKKWTEEVAGYGNNIMKVTRSLNVCPDPECQKIVDAELSVQKKKRDVLKAEREEKVNAAKVKKEQDRLRINENLV